MDRVTPPPRPQALPLIAENIPEALRRIANWVVWKYVPDTDAETGDTDWDKPPFDAEKGHLASSTNPRTWTTCERAVEVYRGGGYDGVGFALRHVKHVPVGIEKLADPRPRKEFPRLVAIDLDKCRDPQSGEVDAWALKVIRDLDSYTEVSPSGRGLRLFLFGVLPGHGRKKGAYENYETGRYVTVTGQHLDGTPRTVEHRHDQLLAVHREQFGVPAEPGPLPANGARAVADLDDRELLERAFRSKSGDRIRSLFDGDTVRYRSRSEADLALCNYLAFWCGRDADRMMRLIAQSGLYRTKWQRDDYRDKTLQKAIAGCTNVYEPRGRGRRAPRNGGGGVNGAATVNGEYAGDNCAGADLPPDDPAGVGGGRVPARRAIVIGVDERRVNDEAVAALAGEPRLFQRANLLTQVHRDTARATLKGITRPPGAPRIVPLPNATLREMMADRATWWKVK